MLPAYGSVRTASPALCAAAVVQQLLQAMSCLQNYTSEAMLALLRGASEAQQQQRLHQLTPSADSRHTLYGAAP